MPADRDSEILREIQLVRRELDFIRTHASTYLGGGVALAYLSDETPIYVNTQDFGGPANILNGGRYEEDNLAVLFSLLKDDTIFLDIGANLGFFALKIGRRIFRRGHVHAFEPHPMLADLAQRSAYLNGLSSVVTLHQLALSDGGGRGKMMFPSGHLGGGAIVSSSSQSGATTVDTEMNTLDEVMGSQFVCDLIKIDVEGHEPQAMRGMVRVLKRSGNTKILFEKLSVNAGYEDQIISFFGDLNYRLYEVEPNANIAPIALGVLRERSGYFLAVPHDENLDRNRNRFSIYPQQLSTVPSTRTELTTTRLVASGASGAILFHGPYWYLPRGVWRVAIRGRVKGEFMIQLACRFGIVVEQAQLRDNSLEAVFTCHNDLVHFECIGIAPGRKGCELTLQRLDFEKIG